MKKNLITICLSFFIFICAFAFYGCDTETKGLSYEICGDGYAVCGYDGSSSSVVIPEKYKGKEVKFVKTNTFYNCEHITDITIPNCIQEIEKGAINNCVNLQFLSLPFVGDTLNGTSNTHFGYIFGASSYDGNSDYVPESLKTVIITGGTSIGYQAFVGCSNLTSITIPNSVTSIVNCAFSGCSGLTSITIPNSVTSISNGAFSGCSSLKSITIPNSVTSIGDEAFSDCSNLTSITIPNSLRLIGEDAFSGCVGIQNIVEDLIYIKTTDNPYFALYDTNNPAITSAAIKKDCKLICSFAFSGCSSLTSITIPDSVTSISNGAFFGCSSLTSITIPDSVTSIGDDAFYNCSSLDSFTANGIYTTLDNGNLLMKGTELVAFAREEITSYTIPNSVTNIGNCAFRGCSSLTSITIPDSVTSIGRSAFSGCSSLTSITIPSRVGIFISSYAFSGCKSLVSIIIPRYSAIGNYAFAGCSKLIIYCEATSQPSGWNKNWNKTSESVYRYSSASVYWYSETQPTTSGNYWHYGVDGVTPIIW